MKGLTPIIAIIILLLITVALAGSAWMYMQNYMFGIIGRSGEITSARCIAGNQGMVIIRNIGTNPIPVSGAASIVVINASTGAPVPVYWSAIGSPNPITEIATGGYGVFNLTCRGMCILNVMIGGRSQQAVVSC